MAYNSEKLQFMEKSLLNVARLIGEKTETKNEDDFVEGLGLINEAQICKNAAESIKEGIFRVVVMGTFKNGKSSIINALIGKRVLPEAAVPATAIVSYIRLGEDPNVHVFYKDGTEKIMSTEEFFEHFKFNAADTEECRNTGKVQRFTDVQDSVVYCNMPLLENGVQILDTPGLEDKESATKVTMEVAANANAIIYTCSAENGGFNMSDVAFFKENFDNRHLNNIFFLINKSDLKLDAELADVKEQIKAQLKKVFMKEDGTFDEELYSKRVFFVSAKNTLALKLGEISSSFNDRDVITFQEFENALEDFLTTDERAKATLKGCHDKIVAAEQSVKHVIDINNLTAKKNKVEVENDIKSAKEILDLSENELKQIKGYFNITTKETQNMVKNNINGIVKAIDDEWEAKLNQIVEESGFGIRELMRVAGQAVIYVGRPDERNEAFQREIEPIVNEVNNFIKEKITDAISNIGVQAEPILEDLAKNVEGSLELIQTEWNEIYIVLRPEGDNGSKPDQVDFIKLLLAILNQDLSLIVGLLGGDNINWGYFLKKAIIQIVLDTLLYIIGGPIGLTLFIIKELYEMKIGNNHLVQGIASKSKDQLVRELSLKLNEKSGEIDDKIASTFTNTYNKIAAPLDAKIQDERAVLTSLEEKYRREDFDFEAENIRCNYILNKLHAISQLVVVK